MLITLEFINNGKSYKGAWSEKQVKLLGFPQGTSRNKGWKSKAIGREISESNAKQFLELRNAHLRRKPEDIKEFIKLNQYEKDGNWVLDVGDLMDFMDLTLFD